MKRRASCSHEMLNVISIQMGVVLLARLWVVCKTKIAQLLLNVYLKRERLFLK